MSRNYKFHDQERPYFVTFTVIRWIDVFTRREYKDILVDSLKYCIDKKRPAIICLGNNKQSCTPHYRHKRQADAREILSGILQKKITKAIKENMQESRREWMLWFFEREGNINPNNEQYQFW